MKIEVTFVCNIKKEIYYEVKDISNYVSLSQLLEKRETPEVNINDYKICNAIICVKSNKYVCNLLA